MKKFFHEFKEFISRGNVMDLAVAVIIGGAFQAIVKSLNEDLITPFIGTFVKTDFTAMVATLRGVEIRYGAFITAVINFLLMSFIIFLMIKVLSALRNLKKKEEIKEEEPTTKKCPFCCSEIAIEATRCPHCTSVLEEKE
ncbi:MAG: large conductance mechanosensitive channel protein MscL [Oscillospiraceae bacterium]|nr:large conductance mechanosensitive channel protein MscL [Oscillospiraceae bacterium]